MERLKIYQSGKKIIQDESYHYNYYPESNFHHIINNEYEHFYISHCDTFIIETIEDGKLKE